MRRLPVFFVLDCSESMVGKHHQQMQQGMQEILQALRKDPYALETVYVSIIAFAGIVRTLVPLVEIFAYYPVKLPLGGGTNLAKALEHLMNEFDQRIIKTTQDVKGDWKPLVYLFTDGRPTDDCQASIQRWQKQYMTRCTLVAVGLGCHVDYNLLQQLTPHCLAFEDLNNENYTQFFKWISASILSQSKSIGQLEKTTELNFNQRYLRLVKEEAPNQRVDEHCITFVGRCSLKHSPYLMKFEREITYTTPKEIGLNFTAYTYQLTECCKIDEDYFTWTDANTHHQHVNSSALQGTPECPHCYAPSAFAMCGCGHLMCYAGQAFVICPWCHRHVSFDVGGDEGFDVQRGRG